MSPKLELVALRKEYDDGAVIAVDGIDLEVAQGETLALLGPSGCGKSTTLNMIVGLEAPTSGNIRIDGVSVVDKPPSERNVGLVFQDYAVFTHMTVAANLAFGLVVRGLPRAEVERRVREVASLLDLVPLLKEPTSRLGGSQLQRVAIGRTLVTRPALLLLDEPLSNLEAEARLAMRRELRRLQAETGLTIIYVTHDQVEALSLAARIAVMSHGRIRQCATATEVYQHPAHSFVAGFLGMPAMNLVRGELARGPDGWVFQRGRFLVPLPDAMVPPSTTVGTRIELGIRAEALRPLADFANAPLAGRVRAIEPRGSDSVVTVEVEDVTLRLIVIPPTVAELGQELALAADATGLVLFNGDNGYALPAGAP
ncbi:MAG: ABC transporter ATP-binding protein [Sphingomonadaceae bacterium]